MRADFVPVGCARAVALRKNLDNDSLLTARSSRTFKRDPHGPCHAKSSCALRLGIRRVRLRRRAMALGRAKRPLRRAEMGGTESLPIDRMTLLAGTVCRYPCCRHSWHRLAIAWFMPQKTRAKRRRFSGSSRRKYGHATRQTETGLETWKTIFPAGGRKTAGADSGAYLGKRPETHALRIPICAFGIAALGRLRP